MRRSLKLFMFFIAIATALSCSKGLKEETFSVYDASKLTKPENGDQAIIGVYAALKDNGGYGYYAGYLYWLYEYPVDVVTTTITSRQGVQLDQLTYDASNNVINLAWVSIYKMIARANEAITLIEGINYGTKVADVALKQQHLAEAKFLRALGYYDATSLWGDVPLMLKPSAQFTDADFNPPLASKDAVEQAMIADLQFAEANLPNRAFYEKNGGQIARATSGAAKALLARLYMRRLEWRKAADKVLEVMGKEYNLRTRSEGGLASMFNTANRSDDEFIFVLKSSNEAGSYGVNSNSFGINSTPWDLNRGYGNFPLHLQFYSNFIPTDDRRNLLTGSYRTLYGQTMNVPVEYGGLGQTTPDVILAKFVYNLKYPHVNNYNYAGFNNVTILRYADVLMMRAEALNELDGPTTENVGLLNEIRTRSGLAAVSASNYTRATLRDLIFDERNREFFMEGRRREDLIRWGKSSTNGVSPLLKFKEKVRPLLRDVSTYSDQLNYEVYPYPLNEIQTNSSLSIANNAGRVR